MKGVRLAFFLGLLVFVLSACASRQQGARLETSTGEVLFRVGAVSYTAEDFRRHLEQEIGPAIQNLLSQGQTPAQITQLADGENVRRTIYERWLEPTIQEELLVQLARQEGIGANAKEIDAVVDGQSPPVPLFGGSQPFETITRQRITTARQQLVFAMIARHTTADMFKGRHIVVADEATADQVIAELRNGRSFTELATQFSTDPATQEEGGELGWVPKGNFEPAYDQVAFSAELNTPVKAQAQGSWYVIVVEARQGQRAFDSIDQLRGSRNAQSFFETTFIPWYQQLRTNAVASGDVVISTTFDPNSVPLPFPPTP